MLLRLRGLRGNEEARATLRFSCHPLILPWTPQDRRHRHRALLLPALCLVPYLRQLAGLPAPILPIDLSLVAHK